VNRAGKSYLPLLESLHHFFPEPKEALYQKIYHSLKKGDIFLLGDYTACCEDEETLLRQTYLEKRKNPQFPPSVLYTLIFRSPSPMSWSSCGLPDFPPKM